MSYLPPVHLLRRLACFCAPDDVVSFALSAPGCYLACQEAPEFRGSAGACQPLLKTVERVLAVLPSLRLLWLGVLPFCDHSLLRHCAERGISLHLRRLDVEKHLPLPARAAPAFSLAVDRLSFTHHGPVEFRGCRVGHARPSQQIECAVEAVSLDLLAAAVAERNTLRLDCAVPGTLCVRENDGPFLNPLVAHIDARNAAAVAQLAADYAPFVHFANLPPWDEWSPVAYAAQAGFPEAVTLLLPHSTTEQCELALRECVKRGDAATAARLAHSVPTAMLVPRAQDEARKAWAALAATDDLVRALFHRFAGTGHPLFWLALWWMPHGRAAAFAVFDLDGVVGELLLTHWVAASPAHAAVIRDDAEALVALPPRVLRRVSEGFSALTLAVCLGRLGCARALLPHCAGLAATARVPATAALAAKLPSPADEEWLAFAADLAEREDSLLRAYDATPRTERALPPAIAFAAWHDAADLVPLLRAQADFVDASGVLAIDTAVAVGSLSFAARVLTDAAASRRCVTPATMTRAFVAGRQDFAFAVARWHGRAGRQLPRECFSAEYARTRARMDPAELLARLADARCLPSKTSNPRR
jgi:hypothetical protein